MDSKIDPGLIRARALLARARHDFDSRRAREAVFLAFRACGLAVSVFHRASGIHLGLPGDRPESRKTNNLAAFYQGFQRFKRRLDGDGRTLINVEEAANWIRRSAMFLDSLEEMTQNSGGSD